MKKLSLLSGLVLFFSIIILHSSSEASEAIFRAKFGNKILCPVNGELFNIKDDTKRVEDNGKSYYFCCLDCAESFKKEPKKYIKAVLKKKKEIFICKHCGLLMKTTDLKEQCKVCRCKRTAGECKAK